MATLYLIRGLPGAGKSTLARLLTAKCPNTKHYEADQYFMVDGEYRFNPAELYRAHFECFANTKLSLEDGFDTIVANTFTTLKEMRNYIEYANDNGHTIVVVNCEGNYGSIHGVPEEAMERMRKRYATVEQVRRYVANHAPNVSADVRRG